MKILVTGGTGFIGSRLIEALLLDREHQIAFTGRKASSRSDFLEQGVQFLRGDLANPGFARFATEGVDAIVHCAGMAGTWGAHEDFYRANVVATKFLLDAAKANGVRRVVNISSPSVYFDFKDQLGLKEQDLPRKFSNAYAETKYQGEMLMRSAHSANFQTVSLRPRSVIGRGDQNVLPRLLRLAGAGGLVQIGDGHNIVDVTTVGNVIEAVTLCLRAPDSAMGETYNITNGAPVKFWDFVDEVLKQAHLSTKRRRIPYAPVMVAAQMNEIVSRFFRRKSEPALLPISVGVISFSMTLDIAKARSRLGFEPKYSTRDGILEFFQARY